MSRQLPIRPNLEHLRNQAKALLDTLRSEEPRVKLAGVLHLIAREYGFASWPKLKAHIRSLQVSRVVQSPFVGLWIANVSRSTQHPANRFQSAEIDFDADEDVLTISSSFVDESGRRQADENRFVSTGRSTRPRMGIS